MALLSQPNYRRNVQVSAPNLTANSTNGTLTYLGTLAVHLLPEQHLAAVGRLPIPAALHGPILRALTDSGYLLMLNLLIS